MTKSLCRGLALAALLATAATAAHAQYLYWVDTNYGAPVLRRAQVYGSFQSEVALPAGSLPEGLAFSPVNGRLVFGESAYAGAAIRSTTPAFVPPVALVPGLSCVRGVAVHPTAGDVYWTTSNLVTGGLVQRSNASGGGLQTLLSLGSAANLRGVAIDAAGAKLYFADFGQNLILRSNLDGTSLEVFQNLGAGAGPWGLEFDPAAQRLYWCEYVAGRVRWAGAAGGAPTTLYGGIANPTYIETLPDAGAPGGVWLVWSEAGAGSQRIVIAYADGSGAFTTALNVSAYGGLAYVAGNALSIEPPFVAPEFALSPVSPNPATRASSVEFALPAEMRARLTLVDVQGRRVASLVDGRLPAGRHAVSLAGAWASGRPAAGVYFLRLEAGGRQATHKLVLAD